MIDTDSELLADYPKFYQSLRADVFRYCGHDDFWHLIRLFFFDRTFRPICSLRFCQEARRLPRILRALILWPCRLLHRLTQQLASVDLPWRTPIGPGFRIVHGWGLVISPGARIGSNVTVFHGATIGQKDHITVEGRTSTFPVIQDNVWIGPHAVITGDVTIGQGSRIAAGTIVVKDVLAHTIVAGNPASVIKMDAPPDVINPAPLQSAKSIERGTLDKG